MLRILKKLRFVWHRDMIARIEKVEAQEYIQNKILVGMMANNILVMQGNANRTTEYEYYHRIHELLKVRGVDKNVYKQVRLGRANDGGYIVVSSILRDDLLSERKIAYSLGISDDVSFDLDLAKLGYEVYQYDHTIDTLPRENACFHWRRIGLTGKEETDTLKKLSTVVYEDGNMEVDGMLLKCDIEGAEWEMLADCEESLLSKFDQIVVELHGLTDYEKRAEIVKVLNKLNKTHQPVHIHANNNASVAFTDMLVTPDTIEVTYVLKDKYMTVDTDIILPTIYDQPCNTKLPDILPGRWNVD